ncbi:MAG: 50S ribosomal protein L16 [Myxococcales bacterium]|nr:50S ribosomal protein L16 [Myxococcales bacterium]USN50897.1 MAG: 50S ribosomal protein L16 [Myxococcales bacterium]
MLSPARLKYRKTQKGRLRGAAKGGSEISFGSVALLSTGAGWVTNKQIEACRIAATRHVKRGAKVYIRIFPDKPVTKKPAEVRMGKGKGGVEGWVACVRRGRILFEIAGVDDALATRALELAAAKLPVSTKIICSSNEL